LKTRLKESKQIPNKALENLEKPTSRAHNSLVLTRIGLNVAPFDFSCKTTSKLDLASLS